MLASPKEIIVGLLGSSAWSPPSMPSLTQSAIEVPIGFDGEELASRTALLPHVQAESK